MVEMALEQRSSKNIVGLNEERKAAMAPVADRKPFLLRVDPGSC